MVLIDLIHDCYQCKRLMGVILPWCLSSRGQRKILAVYARQRVGNKVYGGQSSHLHHEAEWRA
jgi:hypothetical protein